MTQDLSPIEGDLILCESEELARDPTIREFRTVQAEASGQLVTGEKMIEAGEDGDGAD